jgi:hypothetical protein
MSIEQHRNKRLAHFDKIHFVDDGGQIQGISRSNIEVVLEKIRLILNKIKLRFESEQVAYDHIIALPHGTNLIRYFQECGTAQEVNARRVEKIKSHKSR